MPSGLNDMPEEVRDKAEAVAKQARWNPDALGKASKDYQETYDAEAVSALEGIDEVLQRGNLTEGDFMQAVNDTTAKEAKQAREFDETGFYKEVEAEIEEKSPQGILTGMIRELFKRKLPTAIRLLQKDKKFESRLEAIKRDDTAINAINGQLRDLHEELSKKEKSLIHNSGNEHENDIRDEISKVQKAIKVQIDKKTSGTKGLNKLKKENSALVDAVRDELEEEQRVIAEKYGDQISTLFGQREALMKQLNNMDADSNEGRKVAQEIIDIELELEGLKKKLISYKAKRPIFLFERLLGTTSIPQLDRMGQASSLSVANMNN